MIRLLITLFQAPGIMTHEFAHALFCWLSGVPVFKICLLRFRDPPGFVEHGEPEDFISSIMITFGPLIINSVAALLAAAQMTRTSWSPLALFWGYLALVIGLHALPSDGDLEALLGSWKFQVRSQWLLIFFLPLFPVALVLYLLKRFHGRILYALALVALGGWYLKIHGP